MKKIQLGGRHKDSQIRGYALVDDEDFEWLNQWKWHISNEYATRQEKRKNILLHRIILNTPQGMYTDHINGNGLDNRRNNLRVCTRSENQMNRKLQKNNTSGYKGISWNKRKERWAVRIYLNSEGFFLGYFNNKIKAATAYNQKAKELFGEFARLNNIGAIHRQDS